MEERPGMDPTVLIQKSSGSTLHSSLLKVRPHSLIPASRKMTLKAVAMEKEDLQLSTGARQLEMSVILSKQLKHNNKHQKELPIKSNLDAEILNQKVNSPSILVERPTAKRNQVSHVRSSDRKLLRLTL
jgi:hypothetical protein